MQAIAIIKKACLPVRWACFNTQLPQKSYTLDVNIMGKCRQGRARSFGLQVKLHSRLHKVNQSLFVIAAWCIRFSQEPADQSVVLGERVVLSCVVFNYSGIVQWTKDGLALGVGEGLRGEHGLRQLCTSRGVLWKKRYLCLTLLQASM